jgi:SAM-dependent methyltransferase
MSNIADRSQQSRIGHRAVPNPSSTAISQAEGRVLDIGVGSGLSLPLYTKRAKEVIGLEPHPKLLKMASEKAGQVPFKLVEGLAESIPLDDLSPDAKVTGWQDRLTLVWKRVAGGCHLNRPIAALVEAVGFDVSQLETGYMRGPKPMTFVYQGIAQVSRNARKLTAQVE